MSSTFMTSPSLFFTSESVTEGHPDKICDQISDAVLDACIEHDPRSRVACETATKTGFVMLFGEITTHAQVNFDDLARQVLQDIGYDDSRKGFDATTCGVLVALGKQSPNISQGVDHALETRTKHLSDEDVETIGAGDQGMMFGYACTETDTLMPMPIELAHRLTRQLAAVRKGGGLPWLRPDGKAQVTVEYAHGRPKRIDTVLVSTQHAPGTPQEQIREGVIEEIVKPILPAELVGNGIKYFVNPTGSFEIGGPMGDFGLTGRKIIVDTYGGMGRHGGGCFSGKDPTKVDRSGAYAARYVAKHLVAAGLADRCELQIAYAIGVAHPLSVNIETFGTGRLPDDELIELVHRLFDLRPGAIIRDLDLLRPIYQQTASYGHFGRSDLDLPWEQLDRLEQVRAEASVPSAASG